MKRYLVLLLFVLVIMVSCQQEPTYEVVPTNRIRVENKAGETIYLNIRKATDPTSDEYNQLPCDKNIVVYTDSETAYVVSYTIVTGQKTEIKDGILETHKTVGTIQTIEVTTNYMWNGITITGASSWDIEQK